MERGSTWLVLRVVRVSIPSPSLSQNGFMVVVVLSLADVVLHGLHIMEVVVV